MAKSIAFDLNAVEIKAFIPAKDFAVSSAFYEAIGFVKASESGSVAYFKYQHCSFLLQNYFDKNAANNMTMHLLVDDVDAWHDRIRALKITQHFCVKITNVVDQPWGMRDFILKDPSGVCWRIGQNL